MVLLRGSESKSHHQRWPAQSRRRNSATRKLSNSRRRLSNFTRRFVWKITAPKARWLGAPSPVWALIALAVVVRALDSCPDNDRPHLFAIGGNRDACLAVGIPVRRLVLAAFTGNGLIVGIAGILTEASYICVVREG